MPTVLKLVGVRRWLLKTHDFSDDRGRRRGPNRNCNPNRDPCTTADYADHAAGCPPTTPDVRYVILCFLGTR